MRKHTVRRGLRLVLVSLILIIAASYYHAGIADLFAFSVSAEERFYSLGIFMAAAAGGYGAVLTVFGLVLPGRINDAGVRLLPVFMLILTMFMIFIWLMISSLSDTPKQRHLRPNETITI